MKVDKVIVEELPKDCMNCPIIRSMTRDCGKDYTKNYNGAATKGKTPDKRCKIIVKNEALKRKERI